MHAKLREKRGLCLLGCGGASDFILIRLNEFSHETQDDIGLCDCQLHDLTLRGVSLPSGIWVTFSICSEIHPFSVIRCFIMKNFVSIGDRSYYSFWQTGLHTPRKDKCYSLFFSTYVTLSEGVCVYSHPRPTPLFPGMLFSRIFFNCYNILHCIAYLKGWQCLLTKTSSTQGSHLIFHLCCMLSLKSLLFITYGILQLCILHITLLHYIQQWELIWPWFKTNHFHAVTLYYSTVHAQQY